MKIESGIFLFFAAVLLSQGCAKTDVINNKTSDVASFEAFVNRSFSDEIIATTPLGTVILKDEKGTGETVKDSSYIFIRYLSSVLESGLITGYTSESVAKQLKEYSVVNYYGPVTELFCRGALSEGEWDVITASVSGKLDTMRVGGTRTGLIPWWLTGNIKYGSRNEYVANTSGSLNFRYEISILDQTKDIIGWQNSKIADYIRQHGYEADPKDKDHYYCRLKNPSKERKLPADTIIYVNYTGRLVSTGRVFDTNIIDSAKVWGLYSPTASYEPVQINANKDSTLFTMTAGASSVIKGFSMTIARMHPHEKGVGLFVSTLGYGSSGSGKTIPAFAPLAFEIEVVDKPE